MTVRVRKTRERPYSRLIAIPRALSLWILHHDFVQMNQNTISNAMIRTTAADPALAGISMASFRKNFAAVMEQAGVPHEHIDAHCGRYQGAVIQKNYLRYPMRAVTLMRPFIHRVFDGGEKQRLTVFTS